MPRLKKPVADPDFNPDLHVWWRRCGKWMIKDKQVVRWQRRNKLRAKRAAKAASEQGYYDPRDIFTKKLFG